MIKWKLYFAVTNKHFKSVADIQIEEDENKNLWKIQT